MIGEVGVLVGLGIAATFVIAVIGLVIGLNNRREQVEQEERVVDMQAAQLAIDHSVAEMQAAQIEINRRLAEVTVRRGADGPAAELDAILSFKLLHLQTPGMLQLVVVNEGEHPAANVEIDGDNDTGRWRRLIGFERVGAGESKTHTFSDGQWSVVDGRQLAIHYKWIDGTGDHHASTTATNSF